jgi:hypothetical protein
MYAMVSFPFFLKEYDSNTFKPMCPYRALLMRFFFKGIGTSFFASIR